MATEPSLLYIRRKGDTSPIGNRTVPVIKLDNKELFFNDNYIINNLASTVMSKVSSEELGNRIKYFFTILLKEFVSNYLDLVKMIELREIDKSTGQERLNVLCNGIALQGEKIISEIDDKILIKSIKQIFRSLLKKIIYDKSILMKRALEKPRGYPGDYETIEMNYNNIVLSEEMGAYFDNYFLNNNYAIAVRNRKDKMLELLTDFLNSSFKKQRVHILNLGSGSSREIRELLTSPLLPTINVAFTCIDHDEESFNFSKKYLSNLPNNIKINYVKENLLTLLNNADYVKKYYGNIDMIYTIGLADYFLDTILEKLVSFSFNILPNQGTFIIAHKDIDADPLTPIYFDWFCDWKFIPRNEKKLVKIIHNSGIKNYSLNIEREPSGIIFFAKLIKNK